MQKTIWYNAKIVTMKNQGDVAEAICSDGEVIVAVGSLEHVKQFSDQNTLYVDLQGDTVIPGFIEPHNHITDGFINEYIEVACHESKAISDVLKLIKANRETLEKGSWVLGTGYNDSTIAEGRHLTCHDIDTVCSDVPVALFHVSGHILYVNTKALEVAGITAETEIPHGGNGEIVLGEDGKPNGVLLGHAYTLVMDKAPTHSKQKYMDAYQRGIAYANSLGITSVQDGSIGWLGNQKNIIDALSELKSATKLNMRFYLTIMDEQFRGLIAGGCSTGFGDNRLRLGSVKFLVDGSIQGYTAALSEPYYVQGMCDGLPHFTQEELNQGVLHAHQNHCQVALHCNGDAAIDLAINAIEYAQRCYPDFAGRHILIHAQTIREDQLDRVAALNIIPSFFVNHVYYWGDVHLSTFLGEKRARRISPLNSAKKRNIPFTIHTDYVVTPLDPFRLLSCAVTRRTKSGAVLGEEQAVSMYDAVAALTSYAAYSSFEENIKGTLEVGKLADFIVLSKDIFSIDPLLIETVEVRTTVLGGKQVFSR